PVSPKPLWAHFDVSGSFLILNDAITNDLSAPFFWFCGTLDEKCNSRGLQSRRNKLVMIKRRFGRLDDPPYRRLRAAKNGRSRIRVHAGSQHRNFDRFVLGAMV